MSIAEKVKRIIDFDHDATERFMQVAHYKMSKCDYREELKGVAMCSLYTMPCEKVFKKVKCEAVFAWLDEGDKQNDD